MSDVHLPPHPDGQPEKLRWGAFVAASVISIGATVYLSWTNLATESLFAQLGMADQLPVVLRSALMWSHFFFPWGWGVIVLLLGGVGLVAWKCQSKRLLQATTILSVVWTVAFGFVSWRLWRTVILLEESLSQ